MSKLDEVMKICQKINNERELPALLELIANETKELLEADRSSIFLLDREKHELWSIITLEGEQIRFDSRLGITGDATISGQTINVEDVYQDSRFYKKVDESTGYQTRSLLVVPIKNHNGDVIGSFQALNKKNGGFTAQDQKNLELIADHIAGAIETTQLIEDSKDYQKRLLKENNHLWKEVEGRFFTQNILGTSPRIQHVVRLIEQISDTSLNVLITGESGTGKELVAKSIHYNSPRTRMPFVAINCAALPESLLESELFGIEKGVATGVERRIGKFEEASGGTLFLDEIGDLSLTAQAKILRVLQENSIEHVGGRKTIPIDVRILSATNKDLEREIKKGNFREDLFYRLKVIHIHMPSLRQIPEDIVLIASYFMDKYCKTMEKEPKKFAPDTLEYLSSYSWPGNIRELENEVKRLAVLTPGRLVREENLSQHIRNTIEQTDKTTLNSTKSLSLKENVQQLEKQLISETLEKCNHNQKQAAQLLGVSRQGLINKMKRYKITTNRITP